VFSFFRDAKRPSYHEVYRLLAEELSICGGGSPVGVKGRLVGRLQVGIAVGAVGDGIVLEVEEKGTD